MQWLATLVALLSFEVVSGLFNSTSVIVTNDGFSVYPCLQVNHRVLELDPSFLGEWYVIEIVSHRDDQNNQGSMSYNICPKLNLYTPANKQIKVIWHEKAGDIHYNFKMVDPENSGFWLVWGRQTGTLLNKIYEQFSGSVQVIEASPNKMVLTFCSQNRTHFSVIMVRNATLPLDTRDTRRTLIDYGLREVNVRHTTCKDEQSSGFSSSVPGIALIISSLLFSIRIN